MLEKYTICSTGGILRGYVADVCSRNAQDVMEAVSGGCVLEKYTTYDRGDYVRWQI